MKTATPIMKNVAKAPIISGSRLDFRAGGGAGESLICGDSNAGAGGEAMVEPNSSGCCGSVLAIVGGIACIVSSNSNTSSGCGSVCLGSGIASVAFGSNGAERTDPSIKQKVSESSKVRLHSGQLFIRLLRDRLGGSSDQMQGILSRRAVVKCEV